MSEDLVAEFGCLSPVRFAQGSLSRCDGELVRCSCGKPTETALIGNEAFISLCHDCISTASLDKVEFVYSDLSDRECHPIVIDDEWMVNIQPTQPKECCDATEEREKREDD